MINEATTLTAHVETGPGEHVPPAAVTHQVVPRALARAAQVAQRNAEHAGTEHAVGVAGKPSAVQRPVERAGVQAVVSTDRTRGRQAGADPKGRVLRMHACHRWKDGYRIREYRRSAKRVIKVLLYTSQQLQTVLSLLASLK